MYAFASSIDVMLFLLPSIFMLIHEPFLRIVHCFSRCCTRLFEEKHRFRSNIIITDIITVRQSAAT